MEYNFSVDQGSGDSFGMIQMHYIYCPLSFFIIKLIFKKFYLFLGMLGLCCYMGFSLVAVCGILIAGASLVVEQLLSSMWAQEFGSWALEHRLNSCGVWT